MRKFHSPSLLFSMNGSGAPNLSTQFGPEKIAHHLELHERRVKSKFIQEESSGRKLEALPGLYLHHEKVCRWIQNQHHFSHFPIVIGGDHSSAIGTWSGLASHFGKGLGMLWLDAHMDSHTPLTSESKQIHGMPLATLLGHGFKELTSIGGLGPKLDPHRVILFGVRSFEWPEFHFLKSQGVRVYTSLEIFERGFEVCWHEALAKLCGGPFGVSLDWDVFDPKSFPAVGSPVPQGLNPSIVLPRLIELLKSQNCSGFEAVEFDPDFDRDNQSLQIAIHFLNQMIPTLPKGQNDQFLKKTIGFEEFIHLD